MIATKKSPQPISIKKSPNLVENGLAEIYQDMAITMALLTRQEPTEFTRITPFVKCRDFLCDVFTYAKANKVFGIWGMQHDPTKDKPQEDGLYIACIFPNETKQANFERAIEQLWAIEMANGMEPTEFIPHIDGGTGILIADKGWLRSCLSFSLYTSLLRCLSYGIGEDWLKGMKTTFAKKTDGALVLSVSDEVWELVLNNLDLLKLPDFCGFDPTKVDVSWIHHNSGFYSVFGKHRELRVDTVRQNAHWKHFKEQGWKLATI